MSSVLERMNESYCRSYISQHYEGWETRILERYDIQNFIKTLDDQDAEAVIVTARTFTGYWYTDLGFGKMMPGLNGVDQLQQSIDYFRKNTDKIIIAYFTAVYDKDQYDMHPDWRQVGKDGKPLSVGAEKVVCMNSPYREYIKYMVRKLFEMRDIDGMLLDMAFFSDKICYCENCRRKFKAQYRSDIPEKEDFNDPVFRNYIRFRRKSNETFIKEIFDEVRKVKDDVVLYPQYQLLKDRGMNSQNLEIANFSDFIYTDIYWEHGYLPISAISKISKTLCKNLPEIGFMTRPGTHNDAPNMKTLDQIRYESFTVLANACAVHYHDIMWPDGTLQKEMWDRHRIVFNEIQKRVPWSNKGKSAAQVAVLYSEDTMVWYGRHSRTPDVKAHLYGIFRALTELKIDYNIIVDTNEKTLSKYDTLILPNVACLSETECDQIRSFVKDGGGLVASGSTSLCDCEGSPLQNFRLSDVFGASRIDDTGSYSRVFHKYDNTSEIGKNTSEDGMMTNWGVSQKVELTTGKAAATVVYPYTEPSDDRFINSMANPPAVYTDETACVVNDFGKGRCVYFCGEIEKNYLITSFPELKTIMHNAIVTTMRKELKVEVVQDALVEVTTFETEDTLYVHMVNGQANKGISFSEGKPMLSRDHIFGGESYIETRELIQKIIPTHNTKVRISGYEVKDAVLQPRGEKLEFKVEDSITEIFIPLLEYHDIAVISVK